PALVHVEHPAAPRLFQDRLLGLLLGADEEHRAPAGGQVTYEGVRFPELLQGFLEVDDVDAVAFAEDVLLHLRVPALGLVPEMDTGFEQFLHRECCHASSFGWPPPRQGATRPALPMSVTAAPHVQRAPARGSCPDSVRRATKGTRRV